MYCHFEHLKKNICLWHQFLFVKVLVVLIVVGFVHAWVCLVDVIIFQSSVFFLQSKTNISQNYLFNLIFVLGALMQFGSQFVSSVLLL